MHSRTSGWNQTIDLPRLLRAPALASLLSGSSGFPASSSTDPPEGGAVRAERRDNSRICFLTRICSFCFASRSPENV